ncbi:MAG: glycosyltransferase family 4 protein [Ignavibacteriae bacterium]|nr:glycosyltransferase family 4 protein [Ignavibacteriota bacterium]
MKILHLHTSLNFTCGISKTIYLIAKYPVGKNEHFVLAIDGDSGKKFSDSNISISFLNLNRNSKTDFLKIIKFLKKYIKENNIDVVHSHHRFFDFVSYILSFFYKIKRVTSVQSFVYGKKLYSYKSPVLLAASESVKKHLVSYFNVQENRIIVFNNFIDVNEITVNFDSQSIKTELNISSNSYLIGYVGRFSIKEKGIDILINAFKIFNKRHPDSYLIMVGEGEDIKKIKLQQNVKIIYSKENIFDYYKIFDCLILPSRVDPFPLTVLEAGMMKIPFIGADVNGISEIISNNIDGQLFEKEKDNMLIEKMELYYKERDFSCKCAENLHQKVLNKYNCKKALNLLSNIYEKL